MDDVILSLLRNDQRNVWHRDVGLNSEDRQYVDLYSKAMLSYLFFQRRLSMGVKQKIFSNSSPPYGSVQTINYLVVTTYYIVVSHLTKGSHSLYVSRRLMCTHTHIKRENFVAASQL